MKTLDQRPNEVDRQENLTRFVFIKDHFVDGLVAAPAFYPSPKDGQTSVHRTLNSNRDLKHEVGQTVYQQRKDRGSNHSLKGWADFLGEVALDNGLAVTAETEDHPWHANLEQWPASESEMDAIAGTLALKSASTKLK